MAYNTEELIQGLKESGLTQEAYCAQHSIPASTLAYHIRKYKRDNGQTQPVTKSTPSFIPVDLSAQGSSTSSQTVIIVKGNFDCTELVKILEASK